MKTEITGNVAVVYSGEKIINDGQSALELAMSIQYETGLSRLVINKEAVCEDFFVLSTGIAGEVLQKLVNYHIKMAVYGDFSRYTSKPLKDFIFESNKGKHFFFVGTRDEAVQRLADV